MRCFLRVRGCAGFRVLGLGILRFRSLLVCVCVCVCFFWRVVGGGWGLGLSMVIGSWGFRGLPFGFRGVGI